MMFFTFPGSVRSSYVSLLPKLSKLSDFLDLCFGEHGFAEIYVTSNIKPTNNKTNSKNKRKATLNRRAPYVRLLNVVDPFVES